MFNEFLSKKRFPIKDFLNELEKKELIFLFFISSQVFESKIELTYLENQDVEAFYKSVQKIVGTKIRKLDKEELIADLTFLFESTLSEANIYKAIYEYSYDSDADFDFFNTKLLSLERFVTMLFSKKLTKMQADMDGENNHEFKTSLEYFKKRIIYVEKPILNTLGLVALLGRIDFTIEHYAENPISEEIRENFFYILLEQFQEIDDAKQTKLTTSYKLKDISLKKSEQDYKKKADALLKSRDLNKELSFELKQLKKELLNSQSKDSNQIDSELVNQLYSDIQKKDKQIEQHAKDLKNLKEKPNTMYQKMIEGFQDQLATVKIQNGEKSRAIKLLTRQVETWESKTVETYLQEYIEKNGFTLGLYEYINPFVEEFKENLEKEIELIEEPGITRLEQRIGYCLVENNIHYAVFPDGSRIEIKNIPKNMYLGQWQFVKIESDGTFIWLYSYKFDENDRDYLIHEFGSVIYKGNKVYLMKAIWDDQQLEGIPRNFNLMENQVVSVNGKGEFLRFYRSTLHNADFYLDSIKAKGQKAYYTLKIFPNGLLLRDVENGEEEFKVVNTEIEEPIKEQQIICLQDDKIVHVYYSSKFYTFSSFYKKAEHGIVELKNDMVFIRKLSGEVVIVNEIPRRVILKDGDIIKIDEFNNFMTIKKNSTLNLLTDERKKLASSERGMNVKKKVVEKVDIEKEVLIIGKPTYENSYKMSLYKKGYRAEVVDGYEPWVKVKSALKEKDVVVVVTEFISHDNMWILKEEGLDIPIIYSEFDGANRIVEQIEELQSTT